METTSLTVLFVAAVGLLIAFSGGVLYLTVIEWRDRRRRDRDSREQDKRPRRKS